MNASEIIQKIIEREGINPNALAVKMGMKRAQPIYDIISGKIKKISSEYARKIVEVYPHYSMLWLLTGSMEPEGFEDSLDQVAEEGAKYGVTHLEGRTKMVPHIVEECADCGKPNGFDVAIMEDRCPKYVIPGLVGCDFTIPARGRSMINRRIPEKSIKDGDIIGCRKWKSRSYIRWGEVYVLSTTEGITVKQVLPSEQEGYIKCVPFNTDEDFQSFELPVEEIYDWAIVVGVVSVSMWA